MLTLKVITENTDEVVRKLARKGFDAKEVIGKIIELDKIRKSTQADIPLQVPVVWPSPSAWTTMPMRRM